MSRAQANKRANYSTTWRAPYFTKISPVYFTFNAEWRTTSHGIEHVPAVQSFPNSREWKIGWLTVNVTPTQTLAERRGNYQLRRRNANSLFAIGLGLVDYSSCCPLEDASKSVDPTTSGVASGALSRC